MIELRICEIVKMASPFSKSLKRPDHFMKWFSKFFSELSIHSKGLILGLVVILAAGGFIGFFMNRSEIQSHLASNAFFLAQKTLNSEMKGITTKKLDVDTQFSEGVKQLKEIDQLFSSTRAALETRLKLGALYYNHGEFSKALPWYEKAVQTASGFDQAVALLSVGYTYENLGQPNEAIKNFQKALNLGELGLKGDLLMGITRSYEALHDSAKARSTYDKILTELPNTEYSKSADVFKSQLE